MAQHFSYFNDIVIMKRNRLEGLGKDHQYKIAMKGNPTEGDIKFMTPV